MDKETLEEAKKLAQDLHGRTHDALDQLETEHNRKIKPEVVVKVFEILASACLGSALEIVSAQNLPPQEKEKEIMWVINRLLKNGTARLENIDVGCSVVENKSH